MVVDQATDAVEPQVLRIVTELVEQLGTLPARGAVTPGDSLDRDLGLGSLERVELLSRLEDAFAVRFADAVVAEADTPRDLAAAVVASGVRTAPLPHVERVAVGRGAISAPPDIRTVTHALAWHVERDASRVHVVVRSDDGSEHPITYGALWEGAGAVAAGLVAVGVRRGDSVAIMLRTEPAFFPAFIGVLLAGAIPVPIYPPFRMDRLEEYAERQVAILRNADARLLVTFREAERVAGVLRPRVPTLQRVVAVDALRSGADGHVLRAPSDASEPALIQYTSGSTGAPKGVLLTHGNLLANVRALGAALEVGPDDVMVSWLPLYHDMGLIGAWLGSLYHGIPAIILSPIAFLARPARWLQAISAHGGTLSPAPNFAFDLAVRKIADEEIAGVGLGSWRLALNGSEPVSPETIDRFTRRFARYGFRPEAMCPVYGLAESSVGLTCTPPGRGARVDRIARPTFERSRRASPASPVDATALAFVSCGRALPDHEVRIVDARGHEVGERVEGRVVFCGPSVTRGYFHNETATRAVMRDGWMDSGDLGYLAGGELHITGRQKDVIIKAGRNLYPQEIEQVVGDIAGVRRGCVAAFGVTDPDVGTERLVVVAETREPDAHQREQLRAQVIDRVVATLGIPPDTVVVAVPGTVLKTSSGKIRRSATRDAYVANRLARRRPSIGAQWARLLVRSVAARARSYGGHALTLAYAVYVGALVIVTLGPLWALVHLLPPGAVDRTVRRWCRTILRITGCRLSVDGVANVPKTRAVVFTANHSSYVDAVALVAAIPVDFRFVAKRELLRVPVVATVIVRVGHLTVDRLDVSKSVADAARVTDALRGGVSLLFFPEGTFFPTATLLPFRLGAFKAAVDAGAPVVPVAIRGTRDVLPADTWLPRRAPITVTIGTPIAPGAGDWRDIVRLRDAVRDRLERMLAADATPSPHVPPPVPPSSPRGSATGNP